MFTLRLLSFDIDSCRRLPKMAKKGNNPGSDNRLATDSDHFPHAAAIPGKPKCHAKASGVCSLLVRDESL